MMKEAYLACLMFVIVILPSCSFPDQHNERIYSPSPPTPINIDTVDKVYTPSTNTDTFKNIRRFPQNYTPGYFKKDNSQDRLLTTPIPLPSPPAYPENLEKAHKEYLDRVQKNRQEELYRDSLLR